ncbi:hypothetical protein L198_00655 [Cryptococcus wingfieldii CBS 7118]|uniref:C2H2-type domain-containing protein n=1 Tax=Cryptococcus wingfieldii CBS 7118 TaxID=1295528 RepID=A0A1E3K7L7_9TREE|nr:hypothetical protein L198_00655 [Cryptococcus wingfieldii CBS 7118]ODO08916.1 hypothetical protein L198_00655 [Cryptococcus wingfieldii CBS 7118]
MSYRSQSSDSDISTQGPTSLPSTTSPLVNIQYQRSALTVQYGVVGSSQDKSPRLPGPGPFYQSTYTPSEMPRSMTYPAAGYYPSPYSYSTPASNGMAYPQPVSTPYAVPVGVTGPTPASASTSSGYSFGQKTLHQDRPYKCDLCQQSFNRNHDLKRHKRIHLSVKPFACEKCGKTFSRKDALRRHWLVKGCKEDGATAPIHAIAPIEHGATGPPALSPPTPTTLSPSAIPSPSESVQSTPSFSHPTTRPSLSTLPSRRQQGSDLIITPGEIPNSSVVSPLSAGASMLRGLASGVDSANSANDGYVNGGYFEGSMIDSQRMGGVSDPRGKNLLSRLASSPPAIYPPPSRMVYQPSLASPTESTMASPTTATFPSTGMVADGKPSFAMPFPPSAGYVIQEQDASSAATASAAAQQQHAEATEMEKQSSQDEIQQQQQQTWQRCARHRPSFPFPHTTGMAYTYSPQSMGESAASVYPPPPPHAPQQQ